MEKARKQKTEKVVSAIIYSLIVIFFTVEIFTKPITGEDAYQAQCIANTSYTGSYEECISDSLSSIPRFGQLIHTMIISTFYSMPNIGPETIYRLIDAIMCCAIIYLVIKLANAHTPQLNYQDALTAALVTIAILFSNVAQIFFSGFASIHNYVLGVLFTLLFIYQWFCGGQIIAKTKHPGLYYALFIICGFIFGSALEINSVIFFVILITGIIVAKIRKCTIKEISNYLLAHISSIIGALAGFIFVYLIGGGIHAIINRSGNYHSTLKINQLWHNPSIAIPEFFHNTVANFSSFLPYIFLAIIALMTLYRRRKRDSRNKIFAISIIYAILYIIACFSFNSIKWHITASAFCVLLIPITFLMSELIKQIGHPARVFCSIIAVLILVTFNVDNVLFRIEANTKTANILERTIKLNCLDRSYIRSQKIPTNSPIFNFHHDEDAFTNTNQEWYGGTYLVDGYNPYIIVDTCRSPEEMKTMEDN